MTGSESPLQDRHLVSLDLLVSAVEDAYAGPEMANFADDEDIAHPPSGITFGMIRQARAALEELHRG